MNVADWWKKEVWNTEFWFWKLCMVVGFGGFIILQLAGWIW